MATPATEEGYRDEEFMLKKLVLEQACFYCQHSIIRTFMPEDITTFGLNPILPAMAAFHDITTSHYSDHETGHAITLLEYIHSQIPSPGSSTLQRAYVNILVNLKLKAVFNEAFSCDYYHADNQLMHSILDKYFAPKYRLMEGFHNDEDCATDEEYDLVSQSNVYQAIKNVFSSKYCRKDFERTYLLDSSRSRALWETIAEMAKDYVVEIRKLLPLPQLVVDYQLSRSAMPSCGEVEESSAQGDKEAVGTVMGTVASAGRDVDVISVSSDSGQEETHSDMDIHSDMHARRVRGEKAVGMAHSTDTDDVDDDIMEPVCL